MNLFGLAFWQLFTPWIRIRMEADADPGSGFALQPMRIHITKIHFVSLTRRCPGQ